MKETLKETMFTEFVGAKGWHDIRMMFNTLVQERSFMLELLQASLEFKLQHDKKLLK